MATAPPDGAFLVGEVRRWGGSGAKTGMPGYPSR
ncbi:hypothetical protein J2W56_004733 [Nocardia kruczakiae]|uniref:Uncharacterized protein n=1 Tax=Nocardia kruczakiae TaxID=261477 RepID=A0ABU1XLY2_9NOCA|nr:hypothetical protein [Nocardia kruczakiae]